MTSDPPSPQILSKHDLICKLRLQPSLWGESGQTRVQLLSVRKAASLTIAKVSLAAITLLSDFTDCPFSTI